MRNVLWSVLVAFLTTTRAGAEAPSKETRDLEAALHDLRVVYALAADIEAYRAAHNRLPAAKDVADLRRVVELSHPRFGTSDEWGTPVYVESNPVRNTYTVAAAGSDKAFDRATWSTPAQTRNNADDIVIHDGKVVRSAETWVNDMLRARGFDMARALAAARADTAAIHTEFAMWRLRDVIKDYFAEHREYPDLQTLRKLAVEKAVDKLEDPLVDGWGTPFRVRFTPQLKAYRIVAAGANKTFETDRWDETNPTPDYGRDLVMFNGEFVGMWETHPDDDVLAERADDLEQVRATFTSLVSAAPKDRQGSRLTGLMDEAHDAMKAGDVLAAVAKYEEAVKLAPSFVDAGMLSSIADRLTNATSAAMRDAARRIVVLLRRAVDANPNQYNLTASLAGLQRDLGDPQAGHATIDRYAAAHPDDLRIHLLRTRIGTKPGDFDEAARALDAAAASPKNDAEALYTAGILGYEMVAQGALPPAPRAMILRDARKLLERAISVKPDYFEAMTYLNLVLRQQAAAESDPARQKALIEEAERVRSKAVEIIKRWKP